MKVPMSLQPPLVLGLDPGYDRLGWAIVSRTANRFQVLAAGCISSDAKAVSSQRYHQVVSQLQAVLAQHDLKTAALETLFFSKNRTSAFKVAEARGAVLTLLAGRGIEVFEYGPSQIKLAVTGFGQADKKAIMKMLRLQVTWPKDVAPDSLLDDTWDAVGVAVTHLTRAKYPTSSV